MGQEADNEARLRAAYASWRDTKAGDIGPWVALMAEGCQFGSLADGAPGAAFTASTREPAGVIRYLEGLTADWEMLSADMDEFICQGDRVAVNGVIHWRNRKTGKDVVTRKLDLWTMAGGKATSYFEFYDTAKLLAAAA